MKSEPREPLLFIVGNPRSGNTMMARILGKHPQVHEFMELHFFEELCTLDDVRSSLSFSKAINLVARLICIAREGYVSRKDYRRFESEAQAIVTNIENTISPENIFETILRYETSRNKKSIPCVKTPMHVFYIREILSIYPEAKIINVVRDPRDVLLSKKNKWKRRFAGSFIGKKKPLRDNIREFVHYHPITTSKLWSSHVRAAFKFANDKRVHYIRFEDVVENPEKEIHKICQFIGIPYFSGMLEVPQHGSSLVPDKSGEMRINKARSGNWRKGGLNSTEIYICQRFTYNQMRQLGYKCIRIFPNPVTLTFYVVIFPIKLFLAFLLTRERMRNVREAVKRRLRP